MPEYTSTSVVVHPNSIRDPRRTREHWEPGAIDFVASKVQRILNEIFGYGFPHDPILALTAFGHHVEVVPYIGVSDDLAYEIAAILHGEDRRVELSESHGNTSMLFSAAHELGHILLHPVKKHHRERPIDGSAALYRYPHIQKQHRQEWEANKFAASFLMPMDRVIDEYDSRIPIKPLSLSDDVAFALQRKSMQELRYLSGAKNLAIQVAKAGHFDGRYFEYSLCDRFNVSKEAMALRLLEAKLVHGSLHWGDEPLRKPKTRYFGGG